MSDINTTPAQPDGWKAFKGFVVLTLLVFFTFGVAGLGWHAGVVLARVLGL